MNDDEQREMCELRVRVDELLAHNTKLENERRSWKARAEAATACLRAITVEYPIAQSARSEPQSIFKEVRRVAERADMLERDAWTQWAPTVRAFVVDAREVERSVEDKGFLSSVSAREQLLSFVRRWREQLSGLVSG